MKSDDKKIALKISDINSIISFKKWIVKSLDYYKERQEPTESQILMLLNFIRKKIFDSDLEKKKDFLKKIKRIKLRIEYKRKKDE